MGANNTFNPDDFGGDVQAAVSAARAALGAVVLSSGVVYNISTTVLLDWDYAYLGCPAGKAYLRTTSPNLNMVELANSRTGIIVENLVIGRPVGVVADPSACGVFQAIGRLADARLSNLTLERNGVGMRLCGTDFSRIENCRAHLNTGHGFHILASGENTAGPATGPIQWYWSGQNLSGQNGGTGLLIQSLPGAVAAAGSPTGNVCNFHTFANGGYGVAVLGTPQCPLHALRLSNAFLGDDGFDEVYIDAYGGDHMLTNVYMEYGRQRGLHMTAHNTGNSIITNCRADGHNAMGYAVLCNDVLMVACVANNNGWEQSGTPPSPNKWGVYLEGLRTVITGCRFGNALPGIQKQTYGIVATSAASGIIDDTNLRGNNSGPTALGGGAFSTGILIS